MNPTASKTGLLLQCGRPFAESTEVETGGDPGEAARYGSALHAILAGSDAYEAVAYFGVGQHLDESIAHAQRVNAAVAKWLDSGEYGLLEVQGRETSYALNVQSGIAHPTAFDEASHTYPELGAYEIGGTADLVVGDSAHTRIVLDYKTGAVGPFHNPTSLPQMRTLALMTGASHVGIVHAPRSAPVTIFIDLFTSEDRDDHLTDLRQAYARIGDGSLRPGPECPRCPARASCPINMADVVRESNALLRLASGAAPLQDPTDRGALHLFLTKFAALEKRARELIRAEVEAGEIIQRPDGKTLQMVPKRFTTLSLSSIRRALPGPAAEELIADLRARGCVEEGERLEMHAK